MALQTSPQYLGKSQKYVELVAKMNQQLEKSGKKNPVAKYVPNSQFQRVKLDDKDMFYKTAKLSPEHSKGWIRHHSII